MRDKQHGFAIALAWPDTLCKQAGAWYDKLMYLIKINNKGYYKVGHAAIVLVDSETGACHYFDFGRYHAPHGNGRVRSAYTDHDLVINKKADFDEENDEIINIHEILQEVSNNSSTHGTGAIYGAAAKVDFEKGYRFANALNKKDYIPYGPFIWNGTNCSRFVNSVLKQGKVAMAQRFLLRFPWMLSPTPLWNLTALRSKIIHIGCSKQNQEIGADIMDTKVTWSS